MLGKPLFTACPELDAGRTVQPVPIIPSGYGGGAYAEASAQACERRTGGQMTVSRLLD